MDGRGTVLESESNRPEEELWLWADVFWLELEVEAVCPERSGASAPMTMAARIATASRVRINGFLAFMEFKL